MFNNIKQKTNGLDLIKFHFYLLNIRSDIPLANYKLSNSEQKRT
jgi:hypothetical protein